jgi:HEPN domain-containing protein
MNPSPSLDEVRGWLQKASHDLLSAEALLEHDPPIPETAAFHCQQAVEKVLKAFLVWKGIPFERVHSLTYLLDLCEAEEAGFAPTREGAEGLMPFAVEIRYPDEALEVSREEAKEALHTAKTVWNFVHSLLPPDIYHSSLEGSSP